jgi:hypothetical protein
MSDKPFGKKPPAAPLADEWSTVRKTDLVGIVRDDSVLFDRGYWMRYDGAPRPDEPGEVQDGMGRLRLGTRSGRMASRRMALSRRRRDRLISRLAVLSAHLTLLLSSLVVGGIVLGMLH